jgi:hypothetical protein
MVFGDSFTEGVGTSQDSTWPELLENNLRLSTNHNIEVMNFGSNGSDPIKELYKFKKYGSIFNQKKSFFF